MFKNLFIIFLFNKLMKKIIITTIILVILTISIFALNKSLTGFTIKENNRENNKNDIYTHTKAICNESNFCQDYEITCENNQTKSIKPITGAVIQFDEDWDDPRKEEDRERLC